MRIVALGSINDPEKTKKNKEKKEKDSEWAEPSNKVCFLRWEQLCHSKIKVKIMNHICMTTDVLAGFTIMTTSRHDDLPIIIYCSHNLLLTTSLPCHTGDFNLQSFMHAHIC